MSSIPSGIPSPAAGQASSKGSNSATKGAAEAGDGFSRAIASLAGREGGHHGRSTARAGTTTNEQGEGKAAGHADKHGNDRSRADRLSAPSLNATFGKGREASAATEAFGALKQAVVVSRREAASEEGEAVASEEPAADVGNLLDMLAVPAAAQSPAAAFVASVQEFKGRGADKSARQDGQADGQLSGASRVAQGEGKAAQHAAAMPEMADAPEGEADQLFRFARADGKGRDIDLKVTGNGERASFQDSAAAGPKGEAVTVVEARRYIGLAQPGNAGAVTSAIAQDQEWAASLRAHGTANPAEQTATGRVVNTLKIQMNPIDLGLVTATLRLHGEELIVSLQVQTREAYRQLTDDQDAMVKALRAHGFTVDQVSVQLAPTDRSAAAQQQGDAQQQQFSGQQQTREGGEGRQQDGEQKTGRFSNEGSSHEGRPTDAVAGASGGQSAHSGDLYL